MMHTYSVRNITSKTLIGTQIELANTAYARRVGLLKHKCLEIGHGLLIPGRKWLPLMAIHTFGMKFPIDVLFLDKDSTVMRSCTMPPNRIELAWGARMVLETAIGTIEQSRTQRGDVIEFQVNPL